MQRFTLRALLSCLLAVVLAHAAHAQSTRIAYVDMKRLLDNAPQVIAGRAQLAREFAARDAELKSYETKLAGLRERETHEGALMPKTAADALHAEIDTLDRNVARLRDKMRDDLKQRSAEEINRRWPEIHDAVVEYAREKSIDLVVESPVIYASSSIDITDAVLERLRRRAPSDPPADKPQ
jgi:outer membrane protein